MPIGSFVVSALYALLVTASLASDEDTGGPSYLVGAPVDDDPSHAWSVGICQSDGDCTSESGSCSGTLVAPNLVLTARHCVDRGLYVAVELCDTSFMGLVVTDQIFVTVDPDPFGVGSAPDWIRAQTVLLPDDPNLCTSDIALIVLEASVPAEVATPAGVDVETNLATTQPEAVAIVGRGWVEGELVDNQPVVVDDGGGRRRVLENIPVLCVSDEEGACVISDSVGSFTFSSSALVVGPSTLPGDSGAGMFEQSSFAGGSARVIAVSSLGAWSDDTGELSGAGGTRVSLHRDFLVSGALDAAAAAGIDPPDWARDAQPEPDDTGEQPASYELKEPRPIDGGCGCDSTGSAPPALLVLVLSLVSRPARSVPGTAAARRRRGVGHESGSGPEARARSLTVEE